MWLWLWGRLGTPVGRQNESERGSATPITSLGAGHSRSDEVGPEMAGCRDSWHLLGA